MATYAYVHNSLATPFITSPSTSNCLHQQADSDCGSSSGVGGTKNQDVSDECGSSSSSHALTPIATEQQRSPIPPSSNGSTRTYQPSHQNSSIPMHAPPIVNYTLPPPGSIQPALSQSLPMGYSPHHQGSAPLVSQPSHHAGMQGPLQGQMQVQVQGQMQGQLQGQMQNQMHGAIAVAGPPCAPQGQPLIAGPPQGQMIMNGIGPGPGPPPTIYTIPPPNHGSVQMHSGMAAMQWLGPSTSRTNNAVHLHIQNGETMVLQKLNGKKGEYVGPCTLKMMGDPNMTQLPLPLNVPVGHQVHQFIDELGILRHIVLSIEPPNSCTQYPQEMNVPHVVGPNLAGQMTTYPASVIQQQMQAAGAEHLLVPSGMAVPVSPNLPSTSVAPPPPTQFSNHQQNQQNSHGFNGNRKWVPKLSMTEEKPAEPEQDENARIREMLNRIVAPQIISVLTTEVEISWQPIDTSEAGISGEAFPQIDASEFSYQATIYENTGRFVASYTLDQAFNENGQVRNRGMNSNALNKVRVSNLRPNTDYSVQIKATLDDRGVFGEASPHVFFRTAPGCPEAPLMPKLIAKGPDFVTISWRPAANNGAAVNLYYVYVYEDEIEVDDKQIPLRYGTTEAKILGLKPGTSYRFKISSVNAIGESFEKTTIDVTTKHDGPPRKPATPTITGVTHRTIRLSWTPMTDCHYAVELYDMYRKTTTLVRDRLTGTAVQLQDLSPSSEYKIRVFARNTEGESPRSDWVKVRTQSQRINQNHHNQNHNPNQNHIPNQNHNQSQSHPNQQHVQTHHNAHQNYPIPQSQQGPSSHVSHHQPHQNLQNHQPQSSHINHQNHQQNHQNQQSQQTIQPIAPQQPLIQNHTNHQSHSNYVNHNAYAQPPPPLMQQLPNPPLLQTQPIHLNNNNNHSHNMNQNHNQSASHSNHNHTHHTPKEYPPKMPTNPVFIRYVTKKPEVGWKCYGPNAKDNVYHLEGSTMQHPHKFRTIYRGAATTYVISEDDIHYVRVQSISTRGLHSPFTEKIAVPRVEQERAAQKPEKMSPPDLEVVFRGKVRASWLKVLNRTKPRNVVSYELQRMDLANGPTVVYNGFETEFIIDNIPGETTVVARIRASVVTSEFTVIGEWSETVSITTLRDLPKKPKNMRLLHEQNELRWECDDTAKDLRYLIELIHPDHSQTHETKEKFWKIGKLNRGESYKFVILSIHDDGVCQIPEVLEVTIPASVPSQPEAISMDTVGTDKLIVTWTSADSNGSPIINYRLNVLQGQSVIHEAAVMPNEESSYQYTVSNLEPNTQYRVEMCAENAIGRGRAVAMNGRTKPLPPIPQKLECEAEANAMRLRWKGQPTQMSMCYKLVKILKNDQQQTVYEGENLTSKVKNLLQDTEYTFQLRSTDRTTGTSVWSEPATFRTALAPPPVIKNAATATKSATTPGHYVIEWSNVLTVTTSRKQFYRLQVVESNDQTARWHTVYDGVQPSFCLKTTQYRGAILVRVFCIRLDGETEVRGVTSPVTYVSNELNEEDLAEGDNEQNVDTTIPVWRRRLNKSVLPVLVVVCFLFLAFLLANMFDWLFNLTQGSYTALPLPPTPYTHTPMPIPSKIVHTNPVLRDI